MFSRESHTSLRPEPHQDGNVVVAEALGIYDVDSVVI